MRRWFLFCLTQSSQTLSHNCGTVSSLADFIVTYQNFFSSNFRPIQFQVVKELTNNWLGRCGELWYLLYLYYCSLLRCWKQTTYLFNKKSIQHDHFDTCNMNNFSLSLNRIFPPFECVRKSREKPFCWFSTSLDCMSVFPSLNTTQHWKFSAAADIAYNNFRSFFFVQLKNSFSFALPHERWKYYCNFPCNHSLFMCNKLFLWSTTGKSCQFVLKWKTCVWSRNTFFTTINLKHLRLNWMSKTIWR